MKYCITILFTSLLFLFQLSAQQSIELNGKIDPSKYQIICKHHGVNEGHIILPSANARNKPINPAVFQVTYDLNVPEEAKAAFEYATQILSSHLSSTVPINVDVDWDELGPGTLAAAGTSEFVTDFPNSIERVAYPIALAEKIVGQPLNRPSDSDINVFVSSEQDWYFGFNNPADIPADKFDFVSVILHELIHGLGFVGFATVSNDGTARIKNGSTPAIFDVYLSERTGTNLLSNFEDPSVELAAALQSNNIFMNSPKYRTSLNPPKIYTPTSYQQGSSIHHLDLATYRNTNNSLMTPTAAKAQVEHNPGISIDILYDLGWATTHVLHEQKIGLEEVDEDYTIKATVNSDLGYKAETFTLFYSQDTFKTTESILMTSLGEVDRFIATIPAPNTKTRFQYYFSLEDNRNIELHFPAEAPSPLYYQTFYEADTNLPVMDHNKVVNIDDKTRVIPVDAIVTDFYAGVDSVYVAHYINGEFQSTSKLVRDFTDEFRDNLYVGNIELAQELAATDKLEYKIIAVDKSNNKNERILPASGLYEINISETFDFNISYFNDFNNKSSDFSGNGFATNKPTGFTDIAIQSEHPYINAGDDRTLNFTYQLNIPILIQDKDPLIEFDEIVLVEPGDPGTSYPEKKFWDYVIVEGRRVDGKDWLPFLDGYDSRAVGKWLSAYTSNIVSQVSRAAGSPDLYNPRVINMTRNRNFKAGEIVFVRFRLFSDPHARGWGWAIDNLRIQDTQVAIEDFISSNDLSVFPNPVSTSTLSIKANFKQPVADLQIQVYDNNGRLVQSEQLANVQKGVSETVDISNQPDGMYLVVLRINDTDLISRRVIKQ